MNKRKKKKGKKSKSSIWLKSKLLSNPELALEKPLKNLMDTKVDVNELQKSNLRHLRSAKNPQRLLKIKKVRKHQNRSKITKKIINFNIYRFATTTI